MKELHLICNAHLDPVWLWTKQEGMAEALSTFRVAARFCEEYEGFVFCHNESLLYEWVEEHEPALFAKIKRLVKEGKWKIMGGWYLQCDTVMPSGESLIRQIEVGNQYFMEKFGCKPTTAVSFDAFGQTRGLVQILAKTGYDSYVFMRPFSMIPEEDFLWVGYDGSQIIGHNNAGSYASNAGCMGEKLETALRRDKDGKVMVCWGIGNHGGGPSERDMAVIMQFQKDHPEVKVTHSSMEEYFAQVDRSKLQPVARSMVHCMVGCYTSIVRIKQAHRALENELAMCEQMLALSGVKYDPAKLLDAEKALLFNEFHDILPGSCIKQAEEDALRHMSYAREIAANYCIKAFFKLCEGQKEGKRGEIPVLVYNPNPHWTEQEIEVEFQLEDQNWTENEVTVATVRDENGNYLPTQNEKEASSLTLDWRKRIAFRAKLKPMSINRFDCELRIITSERRPIAPCEENKTHFVVRNETMEVQINKKTGLLDRYCVNGLDYVNQKSAQLRVYRDNEDPWGMTVDGYYECIGTFEAVDAQEANRFNGFPAERYENVRVIENGDVRTKLQAVLKHGNSYAVVTYSIPKQGSFVDIKLKLLSNDANVLYKLSFDTPFPKGKFVGQAAFGREEMDQDEKEVVYHKWCAMIQEGRGLAVLNRGTYAGSAKNGRMNLTVLHTPVYSGHPILDRPITDSDRSHDRIDMGEREFSYRLTTDIHHLDVEAEAYNMPAYALSFFPSGAGTQKNTMVEVENTAILISRLKKMPDGKLLIRLYNGEDKTCKTKLTIMEREFNLQFAPFEVKTYLLDENELQECSMTGL